MGDQIGAISPGALRTLGDICNKVAAGKISEDELKRFAVRKNPFGMSEARPSHSKKRNPKEASLSIEIDLSVDPVIPREWQNSGMMIESHVKGEKVLMERRGDEFFMNDAKLELYCSPKQLSNYEIGNDLRKHLEDKACYNANLLDALIKNPHLIPEFWKKSENGNTRYIFFWNTVYRSSDGRLYIRFLCWSAGRWLWDYRWLERRWYSYGPALVSAR